MSELEVTVIPTSKHRIQNIAYAEKGYVPKHPFRMLCIGRSSSGKTNLILWMITNLYKSYFDCHVISPTAGEMDDSYAALDLPRSHFYHPEEGEAVMTRLFEIQEEKINRHGYENVKPILLVIDDSVSYPMSRSPAFVKLFIACRHYSISCILASQAFKSLVPRAVRLQASHLAFFASSLSEVAILSEEFCPPNMSKRHFIRDVYAPATQNYDFLYIDTMIPSSHPLGKYRKNFKTNLLSYSNKTQDEHKH